MPATLVDRIATKMGPHVRSEGQQRALLDRALYGFDVVRSKLMTGQPAAQFATDCAVALLGHGLLDDGTHPMVRVLETLRDSLGKDPAWDELMGEIIGKNKVGSPLPPPPPIALDSERDMRLALTEHFSMVELRALTTDLGVDPEEFGQGKTAFVLDLVGHMKRRLRLPELAQAIRTALAKQ